MTTLEQLDDFSRFAKRLVAQEGYELPLEVIFDRWHEVVRRDEDVARIQASVDDYEKGERGKPIEEFLSEFDEKTRAKKS